MICSLLRKGSLELVEREIPNPGSRGQGQGTACEVCHTEGLFPNITYPLVWGHEIIGIVDAVGPVWPDEVMAGV